MFCFYFPLFPPTTHLLGLLPSDGALPRLLHQPLLSGLAAVPRSFRIFPQFERVAAPGISWRCLHSELILIFESRVNYPFGLQRLPCFGEPAAKRGRKFLQTFHPRPRLETLACGSRFSPCPHPTLLRLLLPLNISV